MSKFCGNRNSAPIVAAAGLWRDRCLVGSGSVFSEDQIWSKENLDAFKNIFVDNPDYGEGSFLDKLEGQLAPAEPAVKQLAAEILWLLQLCPSNIKPAKKRDTISQIYSWSGRALPSDHPQLSDEILGGMGSAGTAYNIKRYEEMVYCIELATRFKAFLPEQQEELLSNGWGFGAWLEEVPDNESRQLRHMLLFMLFPDEFERIFGGSDRRLIAESFSGRAKKEISGLKTLELDRLLLEIRRAQIEEFGTEELDFYVAPLSEQWKKVKTTTYLLTWNPEEQGWESFLSDRDRTVSGQSVQHRWACESPSAAVGDKVYLLRVDEDLGGIIAVGNIVGASYKAPGVMPGRPDPEQDIACVDVEFTRIADPRQDSFIPTGELKRIQTGGQEWAPVRSGIKLVSKAAAKLDKLWHALAPATLPQDASKRPDVTGGGAMNLILYGPPGTGKTYRLKQWFSDYTEETISPSEWRDAILGEMTWFEVTFAALLASGHKAKVGELLAHEFVRRKAHLQGRTKNLGNQMWASLQTHSRLDSKTVNCQNRSSPLVFDKDEDSQWQLVDDWREQCAGTLEKIERIERGAQGAEQSVERFCFVTFHQAYSYEDFVEGIRPHESDAGAGDVAYSVQPGVFRRICQAAKNDPGHRYAIFIDEINRGNVAKILGELITLIELDKRAVYDEEGRLLEGMEATLPYSGDRFGVPKNLDVIATMNTADRSIALLDTALRRRFRFEELMPDPGVISGASGDGEIPDGEGGAIDLRALLAAINRRMRFLLHRDQTLGHAFFTGVKNFDDLRQVLLHEIVPLLQEYFYDDWHRIQLVLRDVGANGERLEPQLVCHDAVSQADVLGVEHDDFDDSIDYWVASGVDLTPDAVRKVYEVG